MHSISNPIECKLLWFCLECHTCDAILVKSETSGFYNLISFYKIKNVKYGILSLL